jgi:hypothetical protein
VSESEAATEFLTNEPILPQPDHVLLCELNDPLDPAALGDAEFFTNEPNLPAPGDALLCEPNGPLDPAALGDAEFFTNEPIVIQINADCNQFDGCDDSRVRVWARARWIRRHCVMLNFLRTNPFCRRRVTCCCASSTIRRIRRQCVILSFLRTNPLSSKLMQTVFNLTDVTTAASVSGQGLVARGRLTHRVEAGPDRGEAARSPGSTPSHDIEQVLARPIAPQ